MPYDLFVSYSRKDNQQNRVSELISQIKGDYHAFAKAELNCFFDVDEINAMDDWRNRILGALRESNLLLLVLSPSYLASPHCEWEIVEFLKYENSRAVQGQGIAQIYFVEIPGLESPDFEHQTNDWVTRVRQRNHVDLRPWREEGASALHRTYIRSRLTDLEKSISERLTRLIRISNAPGNLPAHNPRFVGREHEMERLHKAAGLGRYGILTAVQGVGGMGKTALAIQYAYAYADFYPGGRWLIGCPQQTSLAAAVRSLDADLNIQFSEEEKLDDVRAAKHVLAVLEKRAFQGAAAHAGEQNPPAPSALLILDNVDDSVLLQPPQTDLLSGRTWLHVIATTRLDPQRIGIDDTRHSHLPVDELPDDDGLRLIESYQPQRRLTNETERCAASAIVRMLSGFTLAVEVVAVYLGERKGKVACSALLQRLKHEGVDRIAEKTVNAVNHVQKLLSITLMPTLETLTASENRALLAASLLPADSVPLPWVRTVVSETYPDLGRDAEPGYDDPWLTLVNHLIGLRLLQVTEWAEDGQTPRLCRIHRLVQSVARQHATSDLSFIESSLMAVVKSRALFLSDHWLAWDHRWELMPLSAFAGQSLEKGLPDALWLANCTTTCMIQLGTIARAEPLCHLALEASERLLGSEHPDTLQSMSNLAKVMRSRGDYATAEPLFRRALEVSERALGTEHPMSLASMNNLATLLRNKGDYTTAESLFHRSLETSQRVLGLHHPETLTRMDNMAELLESKGDYAAAEPLYRRTLEARERVLGPEHPDTLVSVNNLALLLLDTGRLGEVEPLFRRSIEGRKKTYGNIHPATANSLVNLSRLILELERYDEADGLAREALAIWKQTDVPDDSRSGKAYWVLGSVAARRGDRTSAQRHLTDALKLLLLGHGEQHPWVFAVKKELDALT